MNLSNKTVIVTGGAGGLGKVIIEEIQKKGAKVYALDLNGEYLTNLKNLNPLMETKVCDVTNPSDLEKVILEIQTQEKKIDVLINSAGVIFNSPVVSLGKSGFQKHSREDWDRIVSINLNSVFYISSSVIEKMVSQRVKGVIVNISSIMAQGNQGQSAYSASKAAVEALTKTWAKELGIFGIRVFCVAPGFANTESTNSAMSEEILDEWKNKVPLRRLSTPEEIAHGIIFGIENDYFNGKVLAIDGGLTV